ncbi:hypothetical protein GCK72_008801 [Caenorhabditis remanei]|uniref:Sdz-33 F-box domain-containing protein n=1 Tax=Caenorhabditis remanei TaxID=31234 RepID=A0A6A5H256_CAERE|nr:hypothetical protein GCK72_008801 [Caenorhabditis remanei]KAF1760552.1 hypothetical protein GCK72_008801 [Caenorhabditis remanei]
MSLLCCIPINQSGTTKDIVEEDDFFRVFVMADQNKESEKLVKKCGLIASGIEIQYEAGFNRIVVKYGEDDFTFNLIGSVKKEDFGKLYPETDVTCFYYFDIKLNGVEILTDRLLEILHNQCVDSLCFRDPHRDIRQLCNFPQVFSAKSIQIDKPSVTAEELDFIGKKFKDLSLVCFHTTPPSGYEAFPLKYRTACIENDSNLEVDDLVGMNCKHLDILKTRMKTSDLNKFIKFWMGCQRPSNIKTITICKLEKDTHLYEGLDVGPWNYELRSRYFKSWKQVAIDCSEGLDVVRDDGKMATINYTDTGVFQFVVWNKRFHEIPEYYPKMLGDVLMN